MSHKEKRTDLMTRRHAFARARDRGSKRPAAHRALLPRVALACIDCRVDDGLARRLVAKTLREQHAFPQDQAQPDPTRH